MSPNHGRNAVKASRDKNTCPLNLATGSYYTMTLDLSKLSPALRHKICLTINRMAYHEYHRMKEDMEPYPPGPVLDEMKQWQQAAFDLSLAASDVAKL